MYAVINKNNTKNKDFFQKYCFLMAQIMLKENFFNTIGT